MLKSGILYFSKIFFESSLFPLLLSPADGRKKDFNLNSNKWKNLMQ